MTDSKTSISRRSFLKTSAMAGGGLMISFGWISSFASKSKEALAISNEWSELNGYLKIAPNGIVTIMSPNPEGGQNVKTSMPMIVAEELDVDWKKVMVEQASLNTELFTRQFIGGSQAIRQGWKNLRTAGATARLDASSSRCRSMDSASGGGHYGTRYTSSQEKRQVGKLRRNGFGCCQDHSAEGSEA